jgi:hypothetical protein
MKVDFTNAGVPFSKALAGAQASPAGRVQGLSIADYMQRRIPSHRPAAADNLSCAASLPSPHAPCHKLTVGKDTVLKTDALDKAPQSEQEPFVNTLTEDRRRILASIDRAAAQFGLPPALIRAVVKAESDYQVRALSPAGAQGLMQLMPITAKELGVKDPFDIDQNIDGGARYLRQMLDTFDGDLEKALAAYNAGPGTVIKYNGNVPYPETRNYVQKVLAYSKRHDSTNVII